MSLKDEAELKELRDLIKINEQISELSEQLNELEGKEGVDQKALEEMKKALKSLKRDAEVLEILNFIPHKEKEKPSSKEESDKNRKATNAEVHEIMDSLSDKKENPSKKKEKTIEKKEKYKENRVRHREQFSELKRYMSENAKKGIRVLHNKFKDVKSKIYTAKGVMKDKIKALRIISKEDIAEDKMKTTQNVNLIHELRKVIQSLKYKPQHVKQKNYRAINEMKKMKALMSRKIKTLMLLVKQNIAKVQERIEKNKSLREKAKVENRIEKTKSLKEKAKVDSLNKVAQEVTQNKVRTFVLSTKSRKYTGEKGTRNKMTTMKMRLAVAVALFGIIGSMTGMAARNAGRTNDSIYGESIKVTPEYLAEMENNLKLREENPEVEKLKVENKNNSAKPSQDKNNSNAKPEEKPSQNNTNSNTDKNNNTNLSQSNSNVKPSQDKNNNNTNLNQNTNTKLEEKLENNNNKENEIKKIYGGEISASENGIRTEEDILYAVKKIGWSKNRVENIKEMMPGLLAMQRDFDIDPLCALAVFQCESGCGTDYTKYGQYRLANIMGWKGQEGVIGYSGSGYGKYNDFASAAYDFGNYVRNSDALKGAKTMYDLEHNKNHPGIFIGAATKDAAIYNKLKSYLEKKVTIDDISKAVDICVESEFKEMTNTIKSNIDNEKSVTQEMSVR